MADLEKLHQDKVGANFILTSSSQPDREKVNLYVYFVLDRILSYITHDLHASVCCYCLLSKVELTNARGMRILDVGSA